MNALNLKSLKGAKKIGLFDSGLGGLSVLSSFIQRQVFSDKEFIYIGDTQRCPYGNRPYKEIREFVGQLITWLNDEGAEAVVMACNTSAALVGKEVKITCPVPVIDLLETTAEYIVETGYERVGIIATNSTANSKAFSRSIDKVKANNGIKTFELGCPELVPIVERGLSDSKAAEEALLPYVQELVKNQAEAIIFGCTHYPFLENALTRTIEKLTDKQIHLINPSEVLTSQIQPLPNLEKITLQKLFDSQIDLVTTGSTKKFQTEASTLLNQDSRLIKVRAVDLSTLSEPVKTRGTASSAITSISPATIP